MTALDITGILERAGADADAAEGSQAWALARLSAAVGEVIAADQEYDAAMREADSTQRLSFRTHEQAMNRLVAARARREKALQCVTAVTA